MLMWGLQHNGYKNDKELLARLLSRMLSEGYAPWLDLDRWSETCRHTYDAFDALIASVSSRGSAWFGQKAAQRRTVCSEDRRLVFGSPRGILAPAHRIGSFGLRRYEDIRPVPDDLGNLDLKTSAVQRDASCKPSQ
jgi:hypothetical protein